MEALLKKILELIVNFFSLTAKDIVEIDRMPMPDERGEHVRLMQKQLNKIFGSQIDEDGVFGLQTKTTVGRFQKSKGLSGSGVLGPKTLELLNLKIKPKPIMNLRDKVYDIALKEIGVKEIRGNQHNPRVLEYHSTTGRFTDDETAWCGSFVSWCLVQAGLSTLGPRGAGARSWLSYGVKTDKPELGDLVIFWRVSPTSWQGHVGFYAGETSTHIKVLGGNQSNAVNISHYAKSQLLGFRSFNS